MHALFVIACQHTGEDASETGKRVDDDGRMQHGERDWGFIFGSMVQKLPTEVRSLRSDTRGRKPQEKPTVAYGGFQLVSAI